MWCRRRESNDTRLLILRNLLQTYERKNRKTRCMPASYVQNHVQQFEGRVRRGPLNAGLRSSPSRIQDSIRELPDGNVSAGRRDAGGSRGIPRRTRFELSDALSRFENSGGSNGNGPSSVLASDQDYGGPALDNVNPSRYFGPSTLDRTHQISFGGYAVLPAGFQLGIIGHFWSPLSSSLVVPSTNLGPGEIFRTDFAGDGTVQDLMPGTHVGSFDRGVNASNINSVIT